MKAIAIIRTVFDVVCWAVKVPLPMHPTLIPLLFLSFAVGTPAQPVITPTTSFQHAAVFLGANVTFSVTASGTSPLSYQWQRDGTPLADGTTSSLVIVGAQPGDEGDYTVVVTNAAGALTSEPARLWVVPPLGELIRGNFTNALGQGMPYFYWIPTNYDAGRSYPLSLSFHGGGDDVNIFPARPLPERLVLASYRQQATDPAILVFPTRWTLGEDWTSTYLQLTCGLLDQMITRFNIDTNRIIVGGGSQGVHAACELVGLRPTFFAAAAVASGSKGSASASTIQHVPFWVACARDDSGITVTRSLVGALRSAGGNVVFTEYNSGGHLGGVLMWCRTPAMNDWALAQQRGQPSTAALLLTITSPTTEPVYRTGATTLSLAGITAAMGQPITQVTWTNFANNARGVASGSNAWSVAGIPLYPNRTNLIIVVGSTTSWASAYGGNTSFNETISVVQSAIPLRATIALQGTNILLNWTGGCSPYRVQRATDLTVGDWTDVLTDAVPPVTLSTEGRAAFYRVVGQ